MTTLRAVLVALFLSSLLSGCVNSRRLDSLEKRISALETQVKAQQVKDLAQHEAWLVCRNAADKSFDEGLRMAGKRDADKPNRYWSDPAVLHNLQETWRDAMADCDRQYPKH